MSVVVVVGAQWGDEGKGKVVDLFAERCDAVVRFGGGANAGHTLVIDGETFVTHLIPSGVLRPGTKCVLGGGMVIDPVKLLGEIDHCKGRGLLAGDELLISDQAHVILPYHKAVEAAREQTANAIGTTRRGIGPCYEAKAARNGVRIRDLLNPARARERIGSNVAEISAIVQYYGGTPPTKDEIETLSARAVEMGEKLKPYVGNVGQFVAREMERSANILFEGAQGTLLDIDHGTYPYVTSGSTIAAGACQGVGIGPTKIDRVIGIAKAYTTRVGAGPFPTELGGAEGDALRQKGGEFGATTGRPRRCGWLDLPALRLAARVNGFDSVAITKLDVLSGLPEIKVCTSYKIDGQDYDEFPTDLTVLESAEPQYTTFAGWDVGNQDIRKIEDLPALAIEYLRAIEGHLKLPLCLVSIGPDRKQTISNIDPFVQ